MTSKSFMHVVFNQRSHSLDSRVFALGIRFCFVVSFILASPPIVESALGQDSAIEAKSNSDAIESAEQNDDFYENVVEPLFRERCYACHDASSQESGLRLDSGEAALAGSDRGKMIIAHNSKESRLLAILAGTDDEVEQMPPPGEGEPFSEVEIKQIAEWIDAGANFSNQKAESRKSDHWAFQPITRPIAPRVKATSWLRSPIDSFVLNRLEEQELSPSGEAERATLIRRLSLDLRGILPTRDETNQFLQDDSPDAYEKLVERMLSSPHFGERWGRHWLDLARYADTDGYEKDRPRPNAWRYRDWVINALNDDISYDEFSALQIAGDLYDNRSANDRIIATGFHRNTLHNTEGGIDPEEDRFKKTIDRTNTYGSIWLGLSVGCAQCHTHKYDPITQREYYSLYAFFDQIDEVSSAARVPFDDIDFERRVADNLQQRERLESELENHLASITVEQEEAFLQTKVKESTTWRSLTLANTFSKHDATFKEKSDGSLLATGPNIRSDQYRIRFRTDDRAALEKANASLLESTNKSETTSSSLITAFRLEVIPDKSNPSNGSGRAPNGNFVLTNVSAKLHRFDQSDEETDLKLIDAKADFSQNNWDVRKAINDDANDGWAVSPKMREPHVAFFRFESPVDLSQGELELVFDQTYPGDAHNLGRFRITFTDQTGELSFENVPHDIAENSAIARADRTDNQSQRIREFFIAEDSKVKQLNSEIQKLVTKPPRIEDYSARSVRDAKQRRSTTMFVRGDYLRPGDSVQTKTLAVLPEPLEEPQLTRRELVEWTFSDSHPLTARVTANRIWARLFGQGLVVTVDDFGTQAQPPSHPQLLDWLASELKQDWSVKRLLREIVRSNTYRQSSALRSDLADIDPNNRLLARQNRRRVEAEIIRDLALQTSGLLDTRIGGPSVRPAQPTEYSSLTYANSAKWSVSNGGDAYRRGLYTFFQRTSPYPMLATFDCPDSNQTAPSRNASNTPIQSLTLWNDPVFVECAKAFAQRILSQDFDSNSAEEAQLSKLEFAFRTALMRSPTEREKQILLGTLSEAKNYLEKNPINATEMLGVSESEETQLAQSDRVELASWMIIARTILNLDEFIVKN